MIIHTFPTEEKNSSRSLALILCDNCIQNTVRASRSSGDSSSTGLLLYKQTTINRQHRYVDHSQSSILGNVESGCLNIVHDPLTTHENVALGITLWNENSSSHTLGEKKKNFLLHYSCLIQKKTIQERYVQTGHWNMFTKLLLQWKSD